MGHIRNILTTLAAIFAFISLTKMPIVINFISRFAIITFIAAILLIVFSKEIARALGER